MHALFLSRRNSYALLSCSSSCLFHELTFCTKEFAYLLFCLMDWLFGDQVSCHTLLLRAEVMYVNNHLLFDHR